MTVHVAVDFDDLNGDVGRSPEEDLWANVLSRWWRDLEAQMPIESPEMWRHRKNAIKDVIFGSERVEELAELAGFDPSMWKPLRRQFERKVDDILTVVRGIVAKGEEDA